MLVHGLGGDHIKTWKAEDKTVWPNDLLPKRLCPDHHIRVLSFEYGGSVKGTSSMAGIDDAANSLLEGLLDKRDKSTGRRPIVFVGHSLGGVIIKRVITVSDMSHLH